MGISLMIRAADISTHRLISPINKQLSPVWDEPATYLFVFVDRLLVASSRLTRTVIRTVNF